MATLIGLLLGLSESSKTLTLAQLESFAAACMANMDLIAKQLSPERLAAPAAKEISVTAGIPVSLVPDLWSAFQALILPKEDGNNALRSVGAL